jgi:phage-related protein
VINIETFPYKAYGQIEKNVEYINRVIQFESGKKQVQRVSINKPITWKFKLSGLNSERLDLEAFFDRQGGNAGTFYWVDENDTTQIVRFSQSKLPIVVKREAGTPVVYECDILLEKVI